MKTGGKHLYRKISTYIEEYLLSDSQRILCIDGARQVGKTYIIRELAKKHFKNYIEINMANDKTGDKLFENVRTIDAFYLKLSAYAGNKLENTNYRIVEGIVFSNEQMVKKVGKITYLPIYYVMFI